MSRTLVEQAVEATANLDELSVREFGAPIVARELVIPTIDDDGLHVVTGHEILPQGGLISLGRNFSALTKKINQGYGLLMVEDGVRRLYPAVITSRTAKDRFGRLHISYLRDHIVLPDHKDQNISDTGEDTTLTPIQKQLLSGARDLQDPSVGTEHSHSTVAKNVTEIGHTAMVLRALTDPDTMEEVRQGKHIVHGWHAGQAGIATKLTQRGGGTPGVFDMETKNAGQRRVALPNMVLAPDTPNVMLVSHSAFKLPEHVDTKFVIGLGLVAARQHFISEDALVDTMVTTMGKVH